MLITLGLDSEVSNSLSKPRANSEAAALRVDGGAFRLFEMGETTWSHLTISAVETRVFMRTVFCLLLNRCLHVYPVFDSSHWWRR